MMGYYDIVLGLIPASFVGLTAFLLVAGVPSTLAVSLAALPAAGLVGHAMFVRAPEGRPAPVARNAGADKNSPRPE